jgi:hypothetical protein
MRKCEDSKSTAISLQIVLVSSAGFTYRLDRLRPRASQFRGPPARCIIFLTLLLDFHIYAVIKYCTF